MMTSRHTITAMVVFVVQLTAKLASSQTTLLIIPRDISHNYSVTLNFYNNTFPQLYDCLVKNEFDTCTIIYHNFYKPPAQAYGTSVKSVTSKSKSNVLLSDPFYVSCNYSVIPDEIVCGKINGQCDINICQPFHLCGLEVDTCVYIVRRGLGLNAVLSLNSYTGKYITLECSSSCPQVETSNKNMTCNTTTSLTSNTTTSMASALTTRSTTRLTATPSSNSVIDSNPQLQTSMTSHTIQPDTSNSSSTDLSTDNKGNTETDNNGLPAIVGSVCGLTALVFNVIMCFFLWRQRRFQANKSSEVHDGVVTSVSTSDRVPSNPDPYYNTLNISGTPNGTGNVNFTENDNRISEVLDSVNKSTEQECNSFPFKNISDKLDDHYIELIDSPEHDNLSNIYDYINDDEVAGTTLQPG